MTVCVVPTFTDEVPTEAIFPGSTPCIPSSTVVEILMAETGIGLETEDGDGIFPES